MLMNAAEPACLVIADVSGYTRYLAGVELDHAHDILSDLLNNIVASLQPTFRLAGLEGDAVFAFVPAEVIDGSVLLDTVEATYFAFRRRVKAIDRATNCECEACRLIPTLDLKIVVHHGSALRYEVAGREELLGPDVIAIHRLLKNDIKKLTGVAAYAFITDACLAATSLDPEGLAMIRSCQEYDIGLICGYVHDLQRAWEADMARSRVMVTPEMAMSAIERVVAAPPAQVFELLTSPTHRPRWAPQPIAVEENSPTSRRGVGTINHCVHGDGASTEEVLDWRPPHYWTLRIHIPGMMTGLMTDEVVDDPAGSRVICRFLIEEPTDPVAISQTLPVIEGMVEGAVQALVDYAAQGADPG